MAFTRDEHRNTHINSCRLKAASVLRGVRCLVATCLRRSDGSLPLYLFRGRAKKQVRDLQVGAVKKIVFQLCCPAPAQMGSALPPGRLANSWSPLAARICPTQSDRQVFASCCMVWGCGETGGLADAVCKSDHLP